MGYWGRIIGVIVFSYLMGRYGVVIGFLIGYYIDQLASYYAQHSNSHDRQQHTSRQTNFVSITFAAMGHLARTRGRITQNDIEFANTVMDRFNLSSEDRVTAQRAFAAGKSADYPLHQKLSEFRNMYAQRGDLLRLFIEIQIQVAFIPSPIKPETRRALTDIAIGIGISHYEFARYLSMVEANQSAYQFNQQDYQQRNTQHQSYHSYTNHNLIEAYRVLGVKSDDEIVVIKRAYRRLMNEHHPDKLLAKGAPPHRITTAKEKTQQIQAAYEVIKKHHGFK